LTGLGFSVRWGRRAEGAITGATTTLPRTAIELRGVAHSYGERPVLTDVSLTLAERRVGVIGANGSGKSTFARLLNGLVVPDHGTVLVDGLDTRRQGREVRRRVGFVFQDPDAQIVHPTVEEDLAFGPHNQGVTATETARRVEEMLVRYDLADHRDHPAHLLSGGQKQLLAIAGVLVMQPERIVFDEPTTLLDLAHTRRVSRVIGGLEQDVVVVTHHLDLLDDFDRVLVFEGGRVVADGSPDEAVPWYVARMS
jgi:biotin transport system ATP-binding protein